MSLKKWKYVFKASWALTSKNRMLLRVLYTIGVDFEQVKTVERFKSVIGYSPKEYWDKMTAKKSVFVWDCGNQVLGLWDNQKLRIINLKKFELYKEIEGIKTILELVDPLTEAIDVIIQSDNIEENVKRLN